MCLYNVVVEFGGDIKKIIKNKTLKNFIRFCVVFCNTYPSIRYRASWEHGPDAVQCQRFKPHCTSNLK